MIVGDVVDWLTVEARMCGTVRFCRVSLVHSHRHDDAVDDVDDGVEDDDGDDDDGEDVDDNEGGILLPFDSSDGLGDGDEEANGADEGALVVFSFDRSFRVRCPNMSSTSPLLSFSFSCST